MSGCGGGWRGNQVTPEPGLFRPLHAVRTKPEQTILVLYYPTSRSSLGSITGGLLPGDLIPSSICTNSSARHFLSGTTFIPLEPALDWWCCISNFEERLCDYLRSPDQAITLRLPTLYGVCLEDSRRQHPRPPELHPSQPLQGPGHPDLIPHSFG